MSADVITIVIIFSIVIWIAVSRESVKSTEKINWRKMMIMISAGTLSTLVLLISLIQNLPF